MYKIRKAIHFTTIDRKDNPSGQVHQLTAPFKIKIEETDFHCKYKIDTHIFLFQYSPS